MSGFLEVFAPILAAAVLGGASAGLLGVLVLGMEMPFFAVCTAHAALAGAVGADLVGVRHELGGFLGAVVGGVLLTPVLKRRRASSNAVLGTLFSLTMGLAFLGIGLGEGPRSSLLGLLWGSLLFVDGAQLAWMAAAAAALLLLLGVAGPALELLLFDRDLAATLLPVGALLAALLVVASAVIAVNLETVGGLMLYALICNPALAALRLARSWRRALVLGAVLGAASAVAGFTVAYLFDLPVGACIVIVSSVMVGGVLWRR